ncbi:phage tail Collar [Alcanivorax sp. 521-1]|uniref:Phage tail Collar n=1 Tax=Alloalcanivorax profundimaris TaxID=2735259 RepID=A0ABS0APB1_9GAMM|nr:tail fiber protein [Alloalcanivorax profundimaris]MBF5055982.1 phage tail Collar [Alloalcanivorax profundimaris]MBM1143439.1 phage tail protein [Alcanivorax sp. ZXX171]
MSEPFLAEIRIVGFNFAPRGWAFCDGQILPINQNQALYSLLGTTYGGNGTTSFALPDLRGRAPTHPGSAAGDSIVQGQAFGAETHTLSEAEMPAHGHGVRASSESANATTPGGNTWGVTSQAFYGPAAGLAMAAGAVDANRSGAVQAHENCQPSLALNFCIALQGLFPSRS